MAYRKETHDECIRMIRKFMTPFLYDLPGYDRGPVNPFKPDKKQFARLIKDCCMMSVSSVDLTIHTLFATFTNKDKIVDSKRAIKKVDFLSGVRTQLHNIMVKKPNDICKYFDKYANIKKANPEESFFMYN